MKRSSVRFSLSLVAFLSLAPAAWASGTVRNGGNAVVCYSDSSKATVTSIELFDYWEAGKYSSYPAIDLGAPTLSVAEKVEIFLDRIAKYESNRAARYRDYANILLHNDSKDFMVDTFPEGPVDDDHPLGLPPSPCYKEQFAVQIRDPLPGERRFQILRSLYENPLTSNDTRAGILLHEIVYRDAITNDHAVASDGSRRVNSFFASPLGESSDAADRKDVYDLAGIEYAKGAIAVRVAPYGIRVLLMKAPSEGEDFYQLRTTTFLGAGETLAKIPVGVEDTTYPAIENTHPPFPGGPGGGALRIRTKAGVHTVVGISTGTIQWINLRMGDEVYHRPMDWMPGYIPVYPNGYPQLIATWYHDGFWEGKVHLDLQHLGLQCASPIWLGDAGQVLGCDAKVLEKGAHIELPRGQYVDITPVHGGAWVYLLFHPNEVLRAVRGILFDEKPSGTVSAKLTEGSRKFNDDIYFDDTGKFLRVGMPGGSDAWEWESNPTFDRQW